MNRSTHFTTSAAAMPAVAVLVLFAAYTARAEDCRLERGPERTVASIIDLETVSLDDGTEVRLAGIVGPRPRDVGVEIRAPEQLARAALSSLVEGKAVRLTFDRQRQDRYGRTVAYVTLGGGAMVQSVLLRTGHARLEAVEGQRGCVTPLIAAELDARAAGRGLWHEPAYRVRTAVPASDLAGYVGTFQILTGRIARVEISREFTRLILGADRRRDLSLVIRAADRDTEGRLGGDLKRLEGRDIEARGWLVQRPPGGLEINVSTAGYLRVLAGQ